MTNDLFAEIEDERYSRVMHVQGVRITICEHRFEICCQEDAEVWEQQVVQMLHSWVRNRKEKLRDVGDLPR